MVFFWVILQNDSAIKSQQDTSLYILIHASLPLSIGRVHHYQIYDIYQLSNFSLTSPNYNNAYSAKINVRPQSKVFDKYLLYERTLIEGFTIFKQHFVAAIL